MLASDGIVRARRVGLGNIRVGNQKEPVGFERLVSSRFLPFMERSYNQDVFYGAKPGKARQPGRANGTLQLVCHADGVRSRLVGKLTGIV